MFVLLLFVRTFTLVIHTSPCSPVLRCKCLCFFILLSSNLFCIHSPLFSVYLSYFIQLCCVRYACQCGETALDVAHQFGHKHIIEYLDSRTKTALGIMGIYEGWVLGSASIFTYLCACAHVCSVDDGAPIVNGISNNEICVA